MAGDRSEKLFQAWLNEHQGIVLKVARAFAISLSVNSYQSELTIDTDNVARLNMMRLPS